jgi:hypothetical protein
VDCVACLERQAHEAVTLATRDPRLREATLREALQLLACVNWHLSPPALGGQLHRLIRDLTRNPDPYAAVKAELNHRAQRLEPVWHRRLLKAYPPFEAAVRLALAGNLLDVGAKTQLNEREVLGAFERALTAPVVGSVAALAAAVHEARQILYLADNAGEIVFDRGLLAQLPLGNLTLAVRGVPVLNDATLADAHWAGLDDLVEVIPNGSDAPGPLLEECSPEFRARFAAADLVIAKGQGNYESLVAAEQRVFFLLNVKCSVVSDALGCPIGSLVVHQERVAPEGRPAAAKPERSHSPSPRRPSPETEVLGLAP